MAAEVSLPCS